MHLAVVQRPASSGSPRLWDRWAVLVCAVVAVVLFGASFFLPWWRFWLYAPQYPKGLGLTISLTGMGGDVHEIDLLNHYICLLYTSDREVRREEESAFDRGARPEVPPEHVDRTRQGGRFGEPHWSCRRVCRCHAPPQTAAFVGLLSGSVQSMHRRRKPCAPPTLIFDSRSRAP